MRQNKNTWFCIGRSGLDRTNDFQKFCGSGLDWIQYHQIRTGLGLKNSTVRSSLTMSNPNGLLSQKLCHHLNQGRTANDILMRAAHWMAYFDLWMYWQRSNPNCNDNRRDKVAMRTTCIKIVKFKIIEIRIDCQYYYSENLN